MINDYKFQKLELCHFGLGQFHNLFWQCNSAICSGSVSAAKSKFSRLRISLDHCFPVHCELKHQLVDESKHSKPSIDTGRHIYTYTILLHINFKEGLFYNLRRLVERSLGNCQTIKRNTIINFEPLVTSFEHLRKGL